MNVELTIEERDFLTSLLKEESKNMLEDLSGSEQVQISDTAIRILNDAHDIVSRIHGKLTHSSTDNSYLKPEIKMIIFEGDFVQLVQNFHGNDDEWLQVKECEVYDIALLSNGARVPATDAYIRGVQSAKEHKDAQAK